MSPSEIYPMYDNYNACATAGYLNSLTVIQELGPKRVEADRVAVHFECRQVHGA